MSKVNAGQAPSTLISEYIGSDFYAVLAVAGNIETVKLAAKNSNNCIHPPGDGNLHVPATGTNNNGYVLKAGATAGSMSWGQLTAADVGAGSEVSVREAFRRSYADAGLTLIDGSFETGGTLSSATDVLLHNATAKAYAWTGIFPHVVARGTDPTTVGSGYVLCTDVVLRNELAGDGGADLIGYKKTTLTKRLAVVGYISEYLVPATSNHTVELHQAISENSIVDLEGKVLIVDYITTKSNCLIRNGSIKFTDALTSSIENPLICGDNFTRGVNSEAKYPTEKIVNAIFHKIKFSNINEGTYRKAMAVFMNAEDCGFYECDFSRVYGYAVRFIGNHIGTTPNTTAYDIPTPAGYCLRPKIRNCTFSDGYFHDGAGKLQLGAAIQLVACKNFDLTNNRVTDCIAGYLVDFLNYGGSITGCSYEVTRQDFYDNIANYHDVVDLYFGQATQRVNVDRHTSSGASRIAAYMEGSSFIDISNSKFNAWPVAAGDTGLVIVQAKLYPTAPELICQSNKVSKSDFVGFETPAVVGSALSSGIDGGGLFDCTLNKRASSVQPSAVLNKVTAFTYRGNKGNSALFINSASMSEIGENYHYAVNSNALIIKAGTYSMNNCHDNSFVSASNKAVYSEPITGNLKFFGGILSGISGLLDGTFTSGLEFIGYDNGYSSVKVVANKPTTIPASDSVSFYESMPGVKFGDEISVEVLSETQFHLSMRGFVNANDTVNIHMSNIGTSAFSGNVTFKIMCRTFADANFKK